MAEEFDASAVSNQLKQVLISTADDVLPLLPPAKPQPLFHTLQDGSVTDAKGNVIKPAPPQAPEKK
jgi:hypothetical protein